MHLSSPSRLLVSAISLLVMTTIIVQSCSDEPTDDNPPANDDAPAGITFSWKTPSMNINYASADVQAQYDSLSWLFFTHLSWPADGDSPYPDTTKSILDGGTATWENYGMNYDIYLMPAGDAMVAWPAPGGNWGERTTQREHRWANNPCAGADANQPVLDEFIQAALDPRPHHPLIDRNSEYVRTGVYYNKPLYDYVRDKQLYSEASLRSILMADTMPVFVVDTTTNDDGSTINMRYKLNMPAGSVMLKSSWKVMGPGDDQSKFYTTTANLLFENHNLASSSNTPNVCSFETVGLVGMHMVYKVQGNKDWIWATFEHADNVPDSMNVHAVDSNAHYNFYDRDVVLNDPNYVNHHPDANRETPEQDNKPQFYPYWFDPDTGQTASQIARTTKISPSTQFVDSVVRENLKGTVWENYTLVGTQWTKEPNVFEPPLLANSTLESFEQFKASCMGCHNQVTGQKNIGIQKEMGNTQYSSLVSEDFGEEGGMKVKHFLQSDWMWSSLKFFTAGQLTWVQIKETE